MASISRMWQDIRILGNRRTAHPSPYSRLALRSSFRLLGMDQPIPSGLQEGLRVWERAGGASRPSLFHFPLVPALVGIQVLRMSREPWDAVDGRLSVWVWKATRWYAEWATFPPFAWLVPDLRTQSLIVWALFYLIPCGLVVAIVSPMISRPLYRLFMISVPSRIGTRSSAVIAHQSKPVASAVRAIHLCAATVSRGGEHGPGRELYAAVEEVENAVRWGHRTRGTVPLLSSRHRPLKEHADLVVGRLRQAERDAHTQGDDAVRDLARLLAKIADRYARGRLWCLLDQEDTAGVTAAKSNTPVKLAGACAVLAAALTALEVVGLPDAIKEPAAGALILVALTLFYERGPASVGMQMLGGGTQ